MIAIVLRELRELSLLAVVLIGAGIGGGYWMWQEHSPWIAISLLALVLGAGAGLVQGTLDRLIPRDPFLRHRPIAPWRIEAARSTAGALITVVAAVAMLNVLMLPWRSRPWPGYGPLTPGLAAICLAAALAGWSIVRAGMNIRPSGRAVLLTPLALLGVGSLYLFVEGPVLGVLFLLAVTGAAVGATIGIRADLGRSRRGRLGLAACAVLVGVVAVCEGAAWARAAPLPPAYRSRAGATLLPAGVLTELMPDGLVSNAMTIPPAGRLTHERWVLTEERVEGAPGRAATVSFRRVPQLEPRNAAQSFGAAPVFGAAESHYAGVVGLARMVEASWGSVPAPLRAQMAAVRRSSRTWVLVSGSGFSLLPPDNDAGDYAAERAATQALEDPEVVHLAESSLRGTDGFAWQQRSLVVLERAARRVVFYQAGGPGTPSVAGVEVALPPGELSVVELPGQRFRRSGRIPPVAIRAGSDVLVFAPDGTELGRASIDATQEAPCALQWDTDAAGGAWLILTGDGPRGAVLATLVAPFDAAAPRVRLRVFSPGLPVAMGEGVFTPTGLRDTVLLALGGCGSLVTPPILDLATLAAAQSDRVDAGFGVTWRNLSVLGRFGWRWLLGSLFIGLLCAAASAKRALWRTSLRGFVAAVATAFLLGPVGALAVAIVVPRTAIEACACGRRRAVDIDVCAACGAAWPGPAPSDFDVLIETREPASATLHA